MSKDAIKKFLENSTDYPDTTMVRIGETEVPLGSLRALSADERSQVSAAVKAADERAAKADARFKEAADIATKAESAYRAAEEARAKATSAPAVIPGADPFADPWLAPVKTKFDSQNQELAALKDMLKQTLTGVVNASTIWQEDRWDAQYNRIDFGKRDKKPTRDELIAFAKENNLLDRHKLPSIQAAWDKFSEADRLEETRKAEFERGRVAGQQEALVNRIPQPGIPGPGISGGPAPRVAPGGDVLGDLYAEASKDPELRELMAQVSGFSN